MHHPNPITTHQQITTHAVVVGVAEEGAAEEVAEVDARTQRKIGNNSSTVSTRVIKTSKECKGTG
jgi:hypothetical protein